MSPKSWWKTFVQSQIKVFLCNEKIRITIEAFSGRKVRSMVSCRTDSKQLLHNVSSYHRSQKSRVSAYNAWTIPRLSQQKPAATSLRNIISTKKETLLIFKIRACFYQQQIIWRSGVFPPPPAILTWGFECFGHLVVSLRDWRFSWRPVNLPRSRQLMVLPPWK